MVDTTKRSAYTDGENKMTKTTRRARKIYDREFKLRAVELAASKTKPIAQIERELGLSSGMLNKWRQQYGEAPINAFPGKGHQSIDDEELKRLRRENKQLRAENEVLKQCVTLFSKDIS